MKKTLIRYIDKFKSLSGGEILLLVILPSIFHYIKGGGGRKFSALFHREGNPEDWVLPFISLGIILLMAVLLAVMGHLSFMCLLAWAAANVYSWLNMLFYGNEEE